MRFFFDSNNINIMKLKLNKLVLFYCLTTSVIIFGQKKELFDHLNLSSNNFKTIEAQVQQGQNEIALKNLLTYYREKENLFLKVGSQDLVYIKQNFPLEVILLDLKYQLTNKLCLDFRLTLLEFYEKWQEPDDPHLQIARLIRNQFREKFPL